MGAGNAVKNSASSIERFFCGFIPWALGESVIESLKKKKKTTICRPILLLHNRGHTCPLIGNSYCCLEHTFPCTKVLVKLIIRWLLGKYQNKREMFHPDDDMDWSHVH